MQKNKKLNSIFLIIIFLFTGLIINSIFASDDAPPAPEPPVEGPPAAPEPPTGEPSTKPPRSWKPVVTPGPEKPISELNTIPELSSRLKKVEAGIAQATEKGDDAVVVKLTADKNLIEQKLKKLKEKTGGFDPGQIGKVILKPTPGKKPKPGTIKEETELERRLREKREREAGIQPAPGTGPKPPINNTLVQSFVSLDQSLRLLSGKKK